MYPKPLYRSEISILKPIYAIHYRAAVCKHCLMEKKKTPKALDHEMEIQRKTQAALTTTAGNREKRKE